MILQSLLVQKSTMSYVSMFLFNVDFSGKEKLVGGGIQFQDREYQSQCEI